MNAVFHDRHAARRHFRAARNRLSPDARVAADQSLCAAIVDLIKEHEAQSVGVFLPNDGEPNLTAILQQAPQGTRFALPVLHPFSEGHLLFLRYDQQTPMRPNIYGIPEPELSVERVTPLSSMQLLFVPLVAFDAAGNRLGMGGGFYDRTLAAWQRGHLPNLRPIGVAYNEQRADALPHATWDVPLPAILTPDKLWQFPLKNV
ncbi:5-formyltetrahydrofolate cyclo-ligase [Aliidiomarina sanyensis]|uniref:5-formyltetrahydrofolate cyclo-ligase n=1 Tax=Aliidiomarina sanyensis TaxID=1249555 RepID=A0A432WBH6_9GAMM|nr:5-formyltetrahydrofolate cyclo-ligase [Aliidiomarina sanyensis]RUO29134.1 5-formyltetrahydrofolate cyclo-ligase [Aliidiomarina sanyensis]